MSDKIISIEAISTCISTSKLSAMVGLHLPVSFLKGLGLQPAFEKYPHGTMWYLHDVDDIMLEIALHFLGRVKTRSPAFAPYGYKKNGEPSLKRGRKEKHVN